MRSLEIFSGAGGLACGLEKAGFEHVGLIEINHDACNSLRKNFDNRLVYEGDIRDYDASMFAGIDLVAGGPPCQPFSLGGKGLAHNDARDMFPQAIRIISECKPKAFIFENVKGLLRESFKEYFDYIILRLSYPDCRIHDVESWQQHKKRLMLCNNNYKGTRYTVTYKLINAADYGVPQTRERVVIVGVRDDLKITWSFPNITHSEDALLWSQYVNYSYWEKHGISRKYNDDLRNKLIAKYGMFPPTALPWLTIRDALKGVPEPQAVASTITPDHVLKSGAKAYFGHTGSNFDYPSKTIKAGGHGVPGGENMISFPDGTYRYFSVYEAKLIQSFPEKYVITGAWGEAMRQIGNAVPVKLATLIAERMFKYLESSFYNSTLQNTVIVSC